MTDKELENFEWEQVDCYQDDYEEFVDNLLLQRSDAVLERFDKHQRLIHALLGCDTEGAELGDIVKKHLYYGKPLDSEQILDECGDLLFYMRAALSQCGYTFADAIAYNRGKLEERYGGTFTESAALSKNREAEARAGRAATDASTET